MTIHGQIRRVWTRGTKAQIIVSVPHRVLRYTSTEDGRLVGQGWADADKERSDVYCLLTDVKGQLVASVCERAAVTKARVALTGNETASGWMVSWAELEVPEAQSSVETRS